MADEVDIANESSEVTLAAALAAQKAKAGNKTKPSGICIWCTDPVEAKKLFCSIECRDSHTLKNRR
jgi:hypothetical protein